MTDSNLLFVIIAVIALIAIIYYLNKNNDQPVPNSGSIENIVKNSVPNRTMLAKSNGIPNRSIAKENSCKDISDDIVDELVMQYNVDDIANDTDATEYSPVDPMANDYGKYASYPEKKHSASFNSDNSDSDKEFVYKKNKFIRKTPDDIKDLFNPDKLLPQEVENWFDLPLEKTKKIKGCHLIQPGAHFGVNTINTSNKNPSHDIRGDIPNPKLGASMWNNSTIDRNRDPNGICYDRGNVPNAKFNASKWNQ
jgi:hypothetical protein